MGRLVDSTIALRGTLAAFRELAPETVTELARYTTSKHLQSGQTLFVSGQTYQNAVFILRQGRMELQRHGADAVTLEPGDVLGLDNYFDNSPYTTTATATSEAIIDVLPAEKLRGVEQRHPDLFSAINRLLTEHLRGQATWRQPVTGAWSLPARAVMKSPLTTCDPGLSIRQAFELMRRRRIGSLGVADEAERLLGMISYATLAEGLISRNVQPEDSVLDTVSKKPLLIDANTLLWKVQSEQERLRAKYLVVVENDKPLGIISQTDILQAAVSYQPSVIAQIGAAADFAELKAFVDRLGQIATKLRQHNRSASMAVRALSEIHLAIQRRCIDLVLAELCDQGMGRPPIPFAFIIMGSGGRKEMMIGTDQDNGIILADTPVTDAEATRQWFMEFCDRSNHRLDELGYEWCTGNIMARNPEFHKSLSQWRQQLSRITETPTEKSARWSTIFFDFETLHGDDRLTVALRQHLLTELKQKPRLLRLMVEDDATGGPALGLFNRLVTANDKERKGKIDLKRNGTRILADAARIYALRYGIAATNSGDRLRALVRLGHLDAAFVESTLAAYDELLDLILGHQLRQLEKGETLDKLLEPVELTPLDEESLRMAMRIIKRLQGRMQGDFGTVML